MTPRLLETFSQYPHQNSVRAFGMFLLADESLGTYRASVIVYKGFLHLQGCPNKYERYFAIKVKILTYM